ncbi:MAG: DUF3372 domain-containing protein [Anaerolineae bacterium]|nr:DUF3372 domain-containing protein [Anaerolineae bacterium]
MPFIHAGQDILRSKSFDGNSYNSGDWFNILDWSYQTTGLGRGVPLEGELDLAREYLANAAAYTPTPDQIVQSNAVFRDFLQIRNGSLLFRLRTAEDVQARVNFHNTGPDQVPGLIVMSLADGGELADLDPAHDLIVVVFNARHEAVSFTEPALAGVALALHPVQAAGADPVVQGASYDVASGTFEVPAFTTAVFVLGQ